MNGLKCPNCRLVNLLSAKTCHRCGNLLDNVDGSNEVSVPVDQTFQAKGFSEGDSSQVPMENETGRKTHFWYRVYCSVMLLIYIAVTAIGIGLMFLSGSANSTEDENEMFFVGIAYLLIGPIFAIAYAAALILPRKPFTWVYGIVMIAIGLTSCCFLPAAVPLLLFWLKPETKAYFGRT